MTRGVAAVGRVLVAEDDRDERDLMAFRLEQAGFDVVTCATGEDVLDLLDGDVVAVVVEQNLAGRSGLEICRALRDSPGTRNLPVLMVSNTGAEEEAIAAFTAGADDWLVEPLHARQFQTRVQSLLNRCGRHPQRGR